MAEYFQVRAFMRVSSVTRLQIVGCLPRIKEECLIIVFLSVASLMLIRYFYADVTMIVSVEGE